MNPTFVHMDNIASSGKTECRKSYAGFSLIELLISITIFSIISLIGMGQFHQYTKRTNRTQAQLELLVFSQQLQQYYQRQHSYHGSTPDLYTEFIPVGASHKDATYQLDLTITDQGQGFLLKAIPVNQMSGDGMLTLDHQGNRRWHQNNTNTTDDIAW